LGSFELTATLTPKEAMTYHGFEACVFSQTLWLSKPNASLLIFPLVRMAQIRSGHLDTSLLIRISGCAINQPSVYKSPPNKTGAPLKERDNSSITSSTKLGNEFHDTKQQKKQTVFSRPTALVVSW
jgi:hypothetical protein